MQTSKVFNVSNIIPNHLNTTRIGSSVLSDKRNFKSSQPYLDITLAQVYNQMRRLSSLVKYLQSQLLIDQCFPYTSGGSAREIVSNTCVSLVKAIVYSDRLDKLNATCPILRTSTSVLLRPLRGIVVSSLRDIAILTITR